MTVIRIFYFRDLNTKESNLAMANSSDEMRQYREAFSLFDKDHDDIIAPQELGNDNFK